MSQTVLVAFEDDGLRQYPADLDPEAAGADYGRALARLIRPLDVLGGSRGVPPLARFVYTDPDLLLPLLDELSGVARANVERVLGAQREWHDTAEGLDTVDRLLEVLGSSSDTDDQAFGELRLGRSLQPIVRDLRALRHVLAAGSGPFHLVIA